MKRVKILSVIAIDEAKDGRGRPAKVIRQATTLAREGHALTLEQLERPLPTSWEEQRLALRCAG